MCICCIYVPGPGLSWGKGVLPKRDNREPVAMVHLVCSVLGCREDACARMYPAWGSGMQLV